MENLENYKVLLIDDHQLSRKLLSKQLELFGFSNIDFCMNGQEGYEQMQRQSYDIVVFDWAMPVMSGLEFFKKLRENNHTDKKAFVMVSAEAQPQKILEAIECGISNYITKPADQAQINQKMTDVIQWFQKQA